MSISITQFNHLRIPLEEILEATNNFSEENIIAKGDFGYIYEGQLLRSGEKINVSAKRLDRSQGQGDVEFLTEISVLSGLKHPNIVSLIGFCDEKGEKIIIHRHEQAKGSLCMYLDDPTLTWEQRLRISVGVANAISYIHYEEGRNYSIIHRNINSSTILLDDNFEAKLSGFEFSIKDSVDRMERYISSEVIGTQGYMDPETIKSGDVTQNSDVYSFGVVLCEIMCGRQAFLPNEEVTNMFLAPLARSHFENDTLQDIINSDIINQGTQKSVELFSIAASNSIYEDREDRPDSKMLFLILCGALIKQLPSSNPESSLDVEKDENDALQLPSKDELGVVVESTLANVWKVNKLEHLRIGLIDILKATDNFSDENKLSFEYEVWNMMDMLPFYTGDLELYDRKYVSSLEGKNIGELPKRHYNVRIMRFKHATALDKFYNAIEILSTCKHENIDSLLGFCHEGSHRILVHEGDTCNLLYIFLSMSDLTWDMRLRICLDVAHGLNYLHNEMEDQKMVIHRAISSVCILLDDEGQGAKITGFELSTLRETQDEDTLPFRKDDLNLWSFFSMAPELSETGKATKESDIYSFGIVMLEILCGMAYITERQKDAEFQAEQWFKDGKIKQRVLRVIREENRGNKLFLKEGPNEDSLDTFIKITERCVAVNPQQRPTLQVIIMELRKALTFQKKHKNRLRIPFKDIRSATQNFSRANDIGGGGFGRVYKGELASEHGSSTIVAKRLDTSHGQGDQQFYNELHILSEYKHKNVIRLYLTQPIDSVKQATLLRKGVGYTEPVTGGNVEEKKPEVKETKPTEVCSVGVVGLVFVVSSLFSNVISTLSLALTPLAAVAVFHDKV
ncbi:protein kinase-like domain, Concanavalin A-like lectin/glucanase domain protein [Artemisia annua]|uniref:Protein kinase-like domain, Concanavalin A-like lectin/glucanase domain protein n=1 Tax=Artemisia annua TaxID=35608 RepID=A0A2U1M0Y6_ARTAN|nr:protein kinase-like domain, Concanavalin A-like lectin/glucanase domain protein [Artemisia annua]